MEKIQEKRVFLRRIVQLDFKIKKELMNMLPILALEVGSVVVGRVIARGIVKWIKEQEVKIYKKL